MLHSSKIKLITTSRASNYRNKNNFAFTLIELLVVIAIIGILSTLGVISLQSARQKARTAKAQHEVNQIYKAIQMLENDVWEWPGHQKVDVICTSLPGGCPANNELCDDGCTYDLNSGFAGLTQNDAAKSYVGWEGPYMSPIPLDPWDNQYFFDTDYSVNANSEPCNGGGGCSYAVVIGSYGPDGVGNNQYNSDDIIKIIKK